MIRVSYDELFQTMFRVLLGRGFESERAELCARLFADASRDGFPSHGLDRFPRFIEMIDSGVVDIHARPVLRESRGALERWDLRLPVAAETLRFMAGTSWIGSSAKAQQALGFTARPLEEGSARGCRQWGIRGGVCLSLA